MRKYRDTWRARIAEALAGAAADAGISGLDTSALVTETPPRPDMGDIAFPMFPFARAFRKAPPVIAREVVKHVTTGSKEADRVEAAGPYVNVRLAPGPVIQDILHDVSEQAELFGKGQTLTNQRITLEFSCPNTNKPLHLGHLRNDAIGESLSRILLAAGATLRKVNLINDRGVHICKSMLAYQMFGGSTTPQSAGMKGDHFVGDFYVKYAQHAKDHPEAEEQVREMLRRWEDGDPDTVALWKKMNSWVMSGIEQTYKRTGISFDQVYFESDV